MHKEKEYSNFNEQANGKVYIKKSFILKLINIKIYNTSILYSSHIEINKFSFQLNMLRFMHSRDLLLTFYCS